jgi:hypothetical protein
MQLAKYFLATTLTTVIGAAGATAQDANHHPAAAAEATAPPVTKPDQGPCRAQRNPEWRWARVPA